MDLVRQLALNACSFGEEGASCHAFRPLPGFILARLGCAPRGRQVSLASPPEFLDCAAEGKRPPSLRSGA